MSRLFHSAICSLAAACAALAAGAAHAQEDACQPLYLVFATGDMGNARLMAQVLQRAKVKATFFAANSPTIEEGDAALSREWGEWWRQRADEGHALALQPWDLPLLRGELSARRGGGFRVKVQTGVLAGRDFTWDADKYCKALEETDRWMSFYAGRDALPLFHAPGGVMTPRLEKAARSCGYAHVPWPTRFVAGDGASGQEILRRAFAGETVQPGATLLAHMGAWPGQGDEDVMATAELLEGLKQRGYCFKTLAEHPDYQQWIKQHPPKAKAAE